MRYEGTIYRPPSEAYSYILQVTVGCAHNRCTFCSMYKDKKFRVRDVEEVFEDIRMARARFTRVGRVFLADGDALCLKTDKLIAILDYITETLPECERITSYGSAKDVLLKTPEELEILRDHGLKIIYIGAESGSDEVLKSICKGVDRRQLTTAVGKIEAAGIKASVTFISGIAGRDRWKEHAVNTGTMISEMEPSYATLLTLMTESQAPLTQDIIDGKFQLLTAEEIVAETLLLVENIDLEGPCVFRSNHASNYISLRGTLPYDKDSMTEKLKKVMSDRGMLKDERFKML